jgi:general secretion pathway protein J
MLMFPKNRGFTLLEILIALFIFTIVALIMTKSLHTVLSTQASTEKAAENLSQTQMALLLLSRDLEQAWDRPISDPEGQPEAAFIGSRNSLTFTHGGFANPNGSAQSSSLQRSRYRLEKDQLIRDTWDALDLPPHTKPHSRVLLSEIRELSFRFLDNKNVFRSFWPSDGENAPTPSSRTNAPTGQLLDLNQLEAHLPRAVELTLTFKQGGRLQQIYLLPQQEVPYEPH